MFNHVCQIIGTFPQQESSGSGNIHIGKHGFFMYNRMKSYLWPCQHRG